MDAKQDSKIASIALTLSNALAQQGDALNNMGHTAEAAYSFRLAFDALTIVPSTKPNYDYLYNAGMLMTMHAATLEGEEANAAFKAAEGMFNAALAAGYEDTEGNIYYFLFHCYYGQRNIDRIYLTKAKEALLTGIQKFPKNNTILDGLMQLYTAEEGIGDPAELVTMIETSLNDDPNNYDLWFGRGRVYNALKNYEECIKSFEKCVELRPNDFEPNFYTAYFIIEKANAGIEAMNSNSALSYEQYEAENAKINLIYAEAIPWLEKAYEIDPNDAGTIEYLNQLCFRLRDMDGIMEKYNKYHAIFMNL
jgi:tetratricopeptide (TPR) repeat protein